MTKVIALANQNGGVDDDFRAAVCSDGVGLS